MTSCSAPEAEQTREATETSTTTNATAQAAGENQAEHPGKVVYNTYCMACHMAEGEGVPGMNPPLSQTEWVLGDKTRLINVVLNGLSEEIVIKGETYNNVMASHSFLTDQQIADVLSYVRQSFGNDATAISVEEVASVRKANEGK
jgi:mono/diheme cytochrome c family protein